MTKFEYVIQKQGDRRTRCIHAAFLLSTEHTQYVCMHYDIPYEEYPFPNVCMDIIKEEYGKRVDQMKPKFFNKLIADMIQTHTDSSVWEKEIAEVVEDFMNDF